MIWNRGYMGAHTGSRIDKRCSVLDLQTVDGICIVAAPDLRCIIKHSGIKPSASSAASFNQSIRITFGKAFQEIIYAKHIIVEYLSLFFRLRRINIRKAPVHIPFDIFYISLVQNRADLVKNMIPDLFSREIKHKLVSASDRIPFWNLKCPVRMCPVQIAVFGNHLRFNPESELQSQIMNPVDQFSHGTSQLLFIDHPVSKAG